MVTSMDTSEKIRENRLRDTARRRGYTLSKSRLRDPLAIGYGRWTVTSRDGSQISPADGWTLDQLEEWLTHQGQSRPADHDEGEDSR